MKSITEFQNFTLDKGLKTQTALAAEGKSPEEIQQSIGETFKLEGDKLKYFINALGVAGQNSEKLKRVLVLSLNEGESAPAKATKVEEMHYLPEYFSDGKAVMTGKPDQRGGGRGKGRRDGPKGSPWGMSPEEKAAKNKGGAKPAKPAGKE